MVAGFKLSVQPKLIKSGFKYVGISNKNVISAPGQTKLAHQLNRLRTWTEAPFNERTPKIVSPDKSYIRDKIILYDQMVDLKAVAVRRVIKLTLITGILIGKTRCFRFRKIAKHAEVVIESKRAVHPIGSTRTVPARRHRPIRKNTANGASTENVTLQAQYSEIR